MIRSTSNCGHASDTCPQLEVDRIIAFKVILDTSETCPQLVVHAHKKFSV
jgi:hypothetical protein